MHSPRKYKMNENYFSNIDTPEKAYWLGFVLADGNISKSSNTLTISLQRGDSGHLYKFVKAIESNYSVKDFINTSGSEQSIVTVTSKIMKNDLASYGVVPNKSLIASAPKNIKFEKDFWRGCIDGDGTICNHTTKGGISWIIGICGTYDIGRSFYEFVGTNLNLKIRKPIKDGSIFKASYNGSMTPIRVIEFLYKDSKIHLNRKMELAIEAMGSERRMLNPKKVDRSRFSVEYLEKQYARYGSWKAVARAEKISYNMIYTIKKELGCGWTPEEKNEAI